MLAVLHLLGKFVINLFRSRRRLEVENLFLRHQLNIALRRAPHRLWLRGSDRAVLVWMTWRWPGLLGMSRIVQPDTILRWHRYLVLWATGALLSPVQRGGIWRVRMTWWPARQRGSMVIASLTLLFVGVVRRLPARCFMQPPRITQRKCCNTRLQSSNELYV
jgi:hypothetical protein